MCHCLSHLVIFIIRMLKTFQKTGAITYSGDGPLCGEVNQSDSMFKLVVCLWSKMMDQCFIHANKSLQNVNRIYR
jgi:hypothetical protein